MVLLPTWFEATLIHEDLVARGRVQTGRDLRPVPVYERPTWLGDELLKERIALKRRLGAMSTDEYARERVGHVGRYAARIGVTVSRASPYFGEVMRACFEAELKALETTFAREGGRRVDHLHRRGAPMENLAHSASFHSGVKSAPSKPGIKHP